MMIMIFYDLLFLIPLTVAALSWTGRLFDASVGESIKIAVAVLFAVYFVLIRRLKFRERLILLGVAASFILAAIFYHPKGERFEFEMMMLINAVDRKYPHPHDNLGNTCGAYYHFPVHPI